ncbi:7TMR-DISM_7TM domain-containing protein, partial [Durusdinium trenchii]
MVGLVMAINTAFLQQPMRAVEGVQDLREWSPDSQSRIMAAGEWAFFWDEYLNPDEVDRETPLIAPTFLYLPGVWNDHLNQGVPLPRTGHGTLVLRVRLPEPGDYLLKIPTLTNDYRLWINGEPKVVNPDMESPGQARSSEATTRYLRFAAPDAEALLVMHIANYRHRAGGIWEPLYLAPADAHASLHSLPVWRDVLLGFLLAAVGIAALVTGYQRNQRAWFWLACYAFFMALRAVTVEERIFFHVFQIYDWQWQQRIEHMLLGLFYAVLLLGFSFAKIAAGRPGAWLLFAGIFLQLLAGLNDIFYTNNVMDSINMLHIGALVFVASQFLVPAREETDEPLPAAISVSPLTAEAPANPYLAMAQRECIVAVMSDALALWDTHGEGGKLALAEQSRQWRVTNDNGTLKTRTLDKYLRQDTLPGRPRMANVEKTVAFVLASVTLPEQDAARLQQALEA